MTVEATNGIMGPLVGKYVGAEKIFIAVTPPARAGAECNICFEDLAEEPGSLHASNPCRIFTCCDECAVAFLARAHRASTPTECPGGCGQALVRADFQRHLGILPGDKVEVRWRGGKGYFPAEVTRVDPEGKFAVRYDDGDVETGVRKAMLRPLAS